MANRNRQLGSIVESGNRESDKPIDREKICPLLLRVFCSTGKHHNVSEYLRGNTPANELQIYTWMDATLKEITGLVKEVNADARKKGTYFDFGVVFPVPNTSFYQLREVGSTCSGRKGADDNISLAQRKFHIGDYLDIAISPPRMGGDSDRMGPPRGMRGRPY